MSKRRNYTNYYSKSTYENKNTVEKTEKPEIEEEVVKQEPEISPEVKIEETKPKNVMPDRAELVENLYVRESVNGPKVPKDELDRLIGSKVIKDLQGNAIVPKGTFVDVYDMTESENGVVWYNTRFGYLMAKNKAGKEYIKAVQ